MGDEPENPWLSDYRKIEHIGPDPDMSATLFASYLEDRGITVMVIVDRVREEFSLSVSEAWDVVRRSLLPDGEAFLREVSLVEKLRQYPDDQSLAWKVAKNLAISELEAKKLVAAFRKATK